jgi:hypothetical protein
VAEVRPGIQQEVKEIRLVAATLDPETGRVEERQRRFMGLQERFGRGESPFT